MQLLAYTTFIMSWRLLSSAMTLVRAEDRRMHPVDLNLEAPPCAVLCCIAIEAFANEISSLTSAFLFQEETDRTVEQSTPAQQHNVVSSDIQRDVAAIRSDPKGSFYDRYKRLLRALNIDKPKRLADLSDLHELRNALVHFRECDVPILEDPPGMICYGQDAPAVVARIQSREHNGRRIVADDGAEWTLRVSTNAMAAWCLSLTLDIIMHVLDHLPAGAHRDFIWKAYASRDPSFRTLFGRARSDLATWWNRLFSDGLRDAQRSPKRTR